MVSTPLEDDDYDEEYAKIIQTGKQNGYAARTIKKIIEKHQRKQQLRNTTTLTPFDEPEKKRSSMPFCGEYFKQVQQLCGQTDHEAVPNSSNYKLKRFLTKTKDDIKKEERSGIYRVACEDGCDAAYIGQSKRKISTRFAEHMVHFRNLEPEKSSIADHLFDNCHFTNIKKLKLLKEVSKHEQLDMLESIAIMNERKNNGQIMNNDNGPVNTVLLRLFE